MQQVTNTARFDVACVGTAYHAAPKVGMPVVRRKRA